MVSFLVNLQNWTAVGWVIATIEVCTECPLRVVPRLSLAFPVPWYARVMVRLKCVSCLLFMRVILIRRRVWTLWRACRWMTRLSWAGGSRPWKAKARLPCCPTAVLLSLSLADWSSTLVTSGDLASTASLWSWVNYRKLLCPLTDGQVSLVESVLAFRAAAMYLSRGQSVDAIGSGKKTRTTPYERTYLVIFARGMMSSTMLRKWATCDAFGICTHIGRQSSIPAPHPTTLVRHTLWVICICRCTQRCLLPRWLLTPERFFRRFISNCFGCHACDDVVVP